MSCPYNRCPYFRKPSSILLTNIVDNEGMFNLHTTLDNSIPIIPPSYLGVPPFPGPTNPPIPGPTDLPPDPPLPGPLEPPLPGPVEPPLPGPYEPPLPEPLEPPLPPLNPDIPLQPLE